MTRIVNARRHGRRVCQALGKSPRPRPPNPHGLFLINVGANNRPVSLNLPNDKRPRGPARRRARLYPAMVIAVIAVMAYPPSIVTVLNVSLKPATAA